MRKKQNGKPLVLLSKVPPLRDICDALGFRNSKEASAFTDFAHKWRKSYTTADHRLGTDLVEWKVPKTQDDLTTMSKTFLYEAGNGKKFWPYLDDPGDKLCFPNDEDKLIELLKQLFWKQNRYAANNQHYTKDKEARDQFRNTSTVSDAHDQQSSMVLLEKRAPSIAVPSIEDTQSTVNSVVIDTAKVAKTHDQRSGEVKPNVLRGTSRNSVTVPADDTYIIQDDDSLSAMPRAPLQNNHRDDQPNIPQHQSLNKPSLETTLRSTFKRPSQSTRCVSPNTFEGGDKRSLKRLKVSDTEYSEGFSSDFGSPRRVSDRKRIPRDITGTVSSADVDKFIIDQRDTLIGGDIPTSQVRNGSSKLRLRFATKKQYPTNALNELKTIEAVDGERTQPLNDATHPLQRQSPPALSPVPTTSVVSNHISSSSSPSTPPSPPPTSTTPLESRLGHSPPSTKHSLLEYSPPPTKPSHTPVAPLAKAHLPIPFHILLHIDGVTRQTFWEAGRFGNKTLEEFQGDLAEKLKCRTGDITMMKLVLRLGSLEIDTDVQAGRADVWEMMKGKFREEIRRAKVRGVGIGMVNVLIEPVMSGREMQLGGDGEDYEFEL